MQAAQQYDDGSYANGLHAPASAGPPEEITKVAEDFCNRYPVDSNAMDYLLTSTPEVQARVVQEFRPPREGEGDYSALLTAFVKRCRADARVSGAQAPQQAAPPMTPGHTIMGAGGQLLTLSASGVYVEAEATQPEALTHAAAGGWASQQEAPMPPEQPLPGTLDSFLLRYPVDERALDYFSCQQPEVQERVLRDFRPPREGENDYSSLFMSFVKRCRADARYAPTGQQPAASHDARRPLAYATPAPLLAAGSSQGAYAYSAGSAGQAAQEQPQAAGGGLDALMAKYPLDERAVDYFSTCPPEVQERIVRDFRPPREGEADYSSLFMSYVKRCRLGARDDAYRRPPWAQHQAQQQQQQQSYPGTAPGGYAGGGQGGGQGGCGGIGAVLSAGPEGLDAFRQRFPIDERAMAYLSESSDEVRERVLNTFVPPQPDDADFSAPVTAYVRECRRLLDGGAGAYFAPQQQQPQQHQPVQVSWEAPAPAADASGAFADSSTDELNTFLQRYPVDARALDYLSTSSPGVVSRVVREFAPKQEGEADYSPLVMAFTKRIRGDERAGAGGYADPPWKRPRAAY